MVKHFFINSFGILISRILGLIRDLLTASILGASIWSDIFFVAFKLPNLFRRLFAEGAFTQSFLPNFIKVSQKGLFLAEIFFKFNAIMLSLSIGVMIFAPFVTKLLAYGFDKHTIDLAVPLVRINFWYLICIFSVTLFASVLQYKNHFATTALSTALLNISMIIALILSLHLKQDIAVYYLSYAVVIGGILQVIAHLIVLKRLNLFRLLSLGTLKYFSGKKSKTGGFWLNFSQGVLGSSANQLGDFISTFIASFLSVGSISYLYYANRIFQLPLALFAIALSTAIFPKISKQIKSRNILSAKHLLKKSFHFLFFLLLFSTIGGFILAREIIWLLFQRGEFDANNTIEAAKVLQMYLLGLIPFGLYKLFSLWLYANLKQSIAAKISIYSLCLNIALSIILFKPLGAMGLALSSSICGLFLFVYSIFIFGIREFLDIIIDKKIIIILFSAIIFIFLVIYIRGILYVYL